VVAMVCALQNEFGEEVRTQLKEKKQ